MKSAANKRQLTFMARVFVKPVTESIYTSNSANEERTPEEPNLYD